MSNAQSSSPSPSSGIVISALPAPVDHFALLDAADVSILGQGNFISSAKLKSQSVPKSPFETVSNAFLCVAGTIGHVVPPVPPAPGVT